MAWRVERSGDVERDLAAIFDFLVGAALTFGADLDGAAAQAARRLRAVNVTRDRAIIYFTAAGDQEVTRVLAAFFGGQDHGARMRRRLDSGGGG